jgi:cytidylate kinase
MEGVYQGNSLEAARELQIDPSRVKLVFDNERRGLFDSVLVAQFDKYYKSDKKIRNTIAKVITNIAREGHVIIVGRGGVAITRDIPASLHIMLRAPLEWRVARISESYKISVNEAKKTAIAIDNQRKEFRESFKGKNNDYTWFDLTINCMTLTVQEIVSIIVSAATVKHLV